MLVETKVELWYLWVIEETRCELWERRLGGVKMVETARIGSGVADGEHKKGLKKYD